VSESSRARRQDKRPFSLGRLIGTLFRFAIVTAVVLPIGLVVVYRFVPPPVTYLMAERVVGGHGMDYRWRSLNQISPTMVNAAIAAEDSRFCEHFGFDFEAIEKAMDSNARGRRLRGGSTISQQTAKNVFLWPGRGVDRYVRKGLEVYFTGLIEVIWGKRRIMEVYLNVAEMGPGVYGTEAAARKYFRKPARKLSAYEASRIAAILPNPLRYKAVGGGSYVQRRSRAIGGNAVTVRSESLSDCVFGKGKKR
jgi:monofunctional biosynthetic peptidoglycan transglycosylase